MAWMPGAIVKSIPRHNQRRAPVRNRVNLHVAVSEAASLYGYFSGASACSHFYVRKDGTIEQYINSDYYSAADVDGNDATISVETQGGVHNAQLEPWTDAQISALARIAVWCSQTHGIPLRTAQNSLPGESSKGISWHRLGVPGYMVPGGIRYSTKPGKICPGNVKISQIPGITALALAGGVGPITNPVDPPQPQPGKNWFQKGDRGQGVIDLQNALNAAIGAGLTADGIFGDLTEQAVKSYQGSRGLIIDGIAGQQTLGALAAGAGPVHVEPPQPPSGPVLQVGSQGPEVARLQQRLKDGYPLYAKKLVVDGIFGPATRAVVVEFQSRSGLVADGIVGPLTRAALGL